MYDGKKRKYMKNNNIDDYCYFKFIKRNLFMTFLQLGYPDTYKGFPNSSSCNIAGMYMKFCSKQRVKVPLLATKSRVCTFDITGRSAEESFLSIGNRATRTKVPLSKYWNTSNYQSFCLLNLVFVPSYFIFKTLSENTR